MYRVSIPIAKTTGSGQIGTIRSNTANTLTVEANDPFSPAPDATSTYEVIDGYARKGSISKCNVVMSSNEPLTFQGHITFIVGTVS